jgi:hypothetical protein
LHSVSEGNGIGEFFCTIELNISCILVLASGGLHLGGWCCSCC